MTTTRRPSAAARLRPGWVLRLAGAVLVGLGGTTLPLPGGAEARLPARPLLLSYSSYREDVAYPRVYFYQHDGIGEGKPRGGIPPGTERSDNQARLTSDGRYCFYNYEFVGKEARLGRWDLPGEKEAPFPLPEASSVEMTPSPSADGRLLAFSSLRRGNGAGWNLFVLEVESGRFLDLPDLNSDEDDRMPSLSGEGTLLAYAAGRPNGAGLQDLYLYDLRNRRHLPLPGLNSPSRETEPALSADGRYLAFVSTRPIVPGAPAGSGDLNLYLYDRTTSKLVDLPGVNGPGSEQSPALSPDGRYLAFVSERISGSGGRDLYLYDRSPPGGAPRLLPLPGLNSFRDEVDPSLTYGSER